MADNVTYPIPDGTVQAADLIGGVEYPRCKIVWGPDGTATDADIASGASMPVQLRSATGLIPIGEPTDAKSTATDITSVSAMSVWKQISFSIQSFVTTFGAAWTRGAGAADANTQRVTIDSAQSPPVGQAAMSASVPTVVASDQTWPKGLSNLAFSAAFSTLTRQANTTAYTAGDSISDNATAGSVTALTATISDVNNDPMFISEILVTSTDTGLAGKRIRAYLYNSDPTASSGVVGGDNLAFSNKKAGYIGSFSGRMEAGFSDGTPGRLVPSFQLSTDTTDTAGSPAGGFLVTKPTSGAKTLFIQFQAIDAFTPSANSTTIIATARGWQARAA